MHSTKGEINVTGFPILYLAFQPTVGNKIENQKLFTKHQRFSEWYDKILFLTFQQKVVTVKLSFQHHVICSCCWPWLVQLEILGCCTK